MQNDSARPMKPKLTSQQINFCFAHLLRSSELFTYAKQHITPQHFNNAGEIHYALLWSSVLSAAARNNNELPSQGAERIIAMELLSKIDESHGEIIPEVGNKAEDLLVWIFATPDTDLNPSYYRSLIQDLIVERTVIGDMAKDMAVFKAVGQPKDILKSLNDYNQKLQSILVNPNNAGQTAFPKNFKPKRINKFSTGQQWLDVYMNGGQAPGEVYAMLGPTGIGKTTQCVMLSVGTCKTLNAMYENGEIPTRKVSCLFTWEQGLESLRLRFWANAATVSSDRLELYADERLELSTRGSLADYEKIEFADAIAQIPDGLNKYPGERERIDAATEELGEVIRIYDYSGAGENPAAGSGGLEEVAGALRALQQEGKEIGVVILDYAQIHVRRMLSARNQDPSNEYHYLHSYIDECKFKIAIPFKCPVWVFAQLNTEANKKSPTSEQHHSMTSGCGSFAENAWFAFCFSTKDKTNDMCRVFCTKERRARGDIPPVILKIEGKYCRLVNISDQWSADDYSKTFVQKSIANRQPSKDIMDKVKAATNKQYTRQDMINM